MTPEASQQTPPADDVYDFDGSSPPSGATPEQVSSGPAPAPSRVAVNAAGKPYDPETGRLLRHEEAAALQPATAVSHSASLLRRAREAGVGEDVIASLGSDALNEIVHTFQEQRLLHARQVAEMRSAKVGDYQNRSSARPGMAAGEDAHGGHDAPPPTEDPLVNWGEIEERDDAGQVTRKPFKEMLHENFVKVIEEQAKRIKALEGQVGVLTQAEGVRQKMSAKQTYQLHFAKHPDLFGSGDVDELDPESAEAARVKAVGGYMQSIAKEKRTTFGKDFDRAVKTLFGKAEPAETPAPSRQQSAIDPRWQQGSAARPTQRSGAAEPAGKEKAERGVRRFQQAVSENNGTADDTFDDGL